MSMVDLNNKTILVTGAAGFIGSNLVKRIYQETTSATVIGIDNMNDYYDVALKEFRLNELAKYPTFTFVKGNIADKKLITELFEKYKPSVVVNLAAQAGVRYSITNPDAYVESNLVGFFNILEACRHCESLEHLVYASSSSVYGSNKKVPYSTDDKVDNPVSLYAATKKSNELMAHGTLHKTAFTEFKEEFVEHPDSKLKFEGYRIPLLPNVVDAVKRMHYSLPAIGVINWDMTLDESGQPVLIEANVNGGSIWLFQMAHGCGVFGERTPEILRWLHKMNETKYSDRAQYYFGE